jgi:hypothetical protein
MRSRSSSTLRDEGNSARPGAFFKEVGRCGIPDEERSGFVGRPQNPALHTSLHSGTVGNSIQKGVTKRDK